jgi:tetratricopeptide (TPR) repeat protein
VWALHHPAPIMKPRTRTLLLVGAVVVVLLVTFDQLAGMSLRFFGTSTLSARAFAHYLAGDYGGAAHFYREDLKRWAEREPAESMSSWLLLARGDLDGAESRARVESRVAPADPEPLLKLAEIALARRDSPRALELAARVLGLRRDDYDALLVSAVAQSRQGAPSAAIDALKRALRHDRAERRATAFLAVLEVTGELDDRSLDARPNCLLAHLHRYLRLYDPSHAEPAIRYALRAIDLGDRADDAYVTLAAIDAKRGRPTRGFARLQQALAVNPRNTAALMDAARYRANRSEVAEEYRLTRAAFDADPHDPFIVAALHRLLVQKLGDYRQALTLAEGAVARTPHDAEAWVRQGQAQTYLAEYRAALHSYHQAATLASRTAELEDRTGHVLLQLGRDEEALAAYQRAVALDPLRPGPHHGLGAVHAKGKRWNDAIREAEMGYTLGGRDVVQVVGLCGLYVEIGRKAEADACLTGALTRDPANAQALAMQEQVRGPRRSASTSR